MSTMYFHNKNWKYHYITIFDKMNYIYIYIKRHKLFFIIIKIIANFIYIFIILFQIWKKLNELLIYNYINY